MDILAAITSKDDIAYKWITILFGNDPSQPLGTAFQTFSTSLTFLGSLFVSWHILIGIISSAYSGKVMGQKWHQIYAPLRVVLGFGMLVPLNDGFSSIHMLLKNVIGVAAVNLGNMPIKAYINSAMSRESAESIRASGGKDVVRFFMEAELCKAVVTSKNVYGGGRGVQLKPVVYEPPVDGVSASYFSSKGRLWDYGACGSITFTLPEVPTTDFMPSDASTLLDFHNARLAAVQKIVTDIRAKFGNTAGGDGQMSKLAKFVDKNAGSDDAVKPTSDLINRLKEEGVLSKTMVSDMIGMVDAYNEAVGKAAALVFNESSKKNGEALKARIDAFGFMAAGSYERSLSVISGIVVGLANDPPTVMSNSLTQRYATDFKKALDLNNGSRQVDGVAALYAGVAEPTDDSGWMAYALGTVFGPNITNMKFNRESVDPVGDMITFGHHMLAIAGIGVVSLSVMSGVGGAFKSMPFAGGAVSGIVEFLAKWIGYLIMICFVVGIIHSFVLPMLPMMMVFVMGVSWLVLYLEAAIAGILWAFAFIRMDGEEFFDRNQSPGVTLLFNLILRPAIGMLAYCGMLLLLPALLRSLSVIWDHSYSVQTGQPDGLLGIVQWLGGIVMFTWMQWHLTMRLTGLIPTIADRVGHWMGFQMHGYNEGGEASAAVGAMVAAGTAAARAPITPGGGRPPQGGGGGGGGNGGMEYADAKTISPIAAKVNSGQGGSLNDKEKAIFANATASGTLQQGNDGKYSVNHDAIQRIRDPGFAGPSGSTNAMPANKTEPNKDRNERDK